MADADLSVLVVDGFSEDRPERLRALEHMCPDPLRPRDYPDSFRAIGAEQAVAWNVPADEHYARHGVLVFRDAPSESLAWISQRVSRLLGGSFYVSEVQYKTHMRQSAGVWLHTDIRADREVLVLLYLSDLRDADGARLVLFSRGAERPANLRWEPNYVSGEPIVDIERPIETAAVGGEWSHGRVVLMPRKSVQPARDRAVILDHRAGKANVHAVTQLRTNASRRLVEVWLRATRSSSP